MHRVLAQSSLLTALSFVASCGGEPKAAPAPPPPEVKVAVVLQRDVPVHVECIGETRGNTEIEIRARVEGFIESVDFQEGSLVKKGDALYTIDSKPFEAKLAAAKASQAEAEAQLARTHQDVSRYEPLVAKNAISRQEYDTAVALEKAAVAMVDAAKAVVEQAKIDLSYTKVIAPEDGLAGRTEVYAGTLVGRGQSTLLTRISRVDPIHVRFSFPEKDYLTYARKRGSGTGGGKEIPFQLVMGDGSVHPQPGTLVFVDRNVDARTAPTMAEASFPNPGDILRPGQYGRVRATVDERPGAILVPQRAVQEMQGVFSVMVVGAEDKVEQRLVMPAERMGALWVMKSGLKGEERVVVEGLQKIRPGMKVNPQVVLLDEEGKVESKGGEEGKAHAPEATGTKTADEAK